MLYITLALASLASGAVPEESMTVAETIQYWDYPVETHDVVTVDGYVLYRIKHGRNPSRVSNITSCDSKRPILLAHGLGLGSAQFIMNPPELSPGMILADAGFDVFMMNHRGTTYSKRLLRFTPQDEHFWKFPLYEYSNYDATATVDKVLEISGYSSLYWIGHSQGTLVGFMMLADNPEYNTKVKALFQMALVGTAHYVRGIGRIISNFYGILKNVVYFTGAREITPRIPRYLSELTRFICLQFLNSEIRLCNDPSPHFNQSRFPVYMNNYPCGTSTWTQLHWSQIGSRDRIEHFDLSPERNRQIFGKGTFEVEEYNHLDFALATNNAQKVFSIIVELVRKYESAR